MSRKSAAENLQPDDEAATRNTLAFEMIKAEESLIRIQRLKKVLDHYNPSVFAGIQNLETTKIGNAEDLRRVQASLASAQRALESFGLDLMKQLLRDYSYSDIFEISRAGDFFKRSAIGRKVKINGEEVVLSKELVDTLALNFTVGTPPVTERAIKQFRSIVLGNSSPAELKEFARLFPEVVDYERMSLLVDKINQAIEQDTRYLTAEERQAHLSKAEEFGALREGKHFFKAVVSGGPKRAEVLLTDYLFKHQGASVVVKQVEQVVPDLIGEIEKNPGKVFILHVSEVHRSMTNDPRWRKQLGRIVIIDHSKSAERSGTCYVLSVFDNVTAALNTVHTNIAGTPSATQMALREIIDTFEPQEIETLYQRVSSMFRNLDTKIMNVGYSGRDMFSADDDEARTLIADWHSLKRFMKTLEVIKSFNLPEEVGGADTPEKEAPKANPGFAEFAKELVAETEKNWQTYLYRTLSEHHGYKGIAGNGGGREGLHFVGLYLHKKLQEEAKKYNVEILEAKLRGWSALNTHHSAYREAESREELSTRSDRATREAATIRGDHRRLFAEISRELGSEFGGATKVILGLLFRGIDYVSRSQEPVTALLARLETLLHDQFIPRDEDKLPGDEFSRALLGLGDRFGINIGKFLKAIHQKIIEKYEKPKARPEMVREILNKLRKKEPLNGRLVLQEIGWTYGNVFEKDLYTSDQPSTEIKIQIEVSENGRPKVMELRRNLLMLREAFSPVPELFPLFCKSMTMVINSPHNPTGKVLNEADMMALMDVAADFGLNVVDDSSYYKMFRKRKTDKGRRQYPPLAELYEQHRAFFQGRELNIITIATPTKNQCAAGGRTHMVLTKDKELEAYLRDQYSLGKMTPNLFAMHFLNEKLKHGIKVKDYYNALYNKLNEKKLSEPSIEEWLVFFEKNLSPKTLLNSGISYETYKLITDTYYQLCLMTGRGATKKHARKVIEDLLKKLKSSRVDKAAVEDADKRFNVAEEAIKGAERQILECKKRQLDSASGEQSDPESKQAPAGFLAKLQALGTKYAEEITGTSQRVFVVIEPDGAFYINLSLPQLSTNRHPVNKFLKILNARTGVGAVPTGGTSNSVRFSLGGKLDGDAQSYEMLETKLQLGLSEIYKRWEEASGYENLEDFEKNLAVEMRDDVNFSELMSLRFEALKKYRKPSKRKVQIANPAEERTIHKIEDASMAVNIILGAADCADVGVFLKSRAFRTIYNFFLRNYREEINEPELRILSAEEALAHYSVSRFAMVALDQAVSGDVSDRDRAIFGKIFEMIHRHWYEVATRTHLMVSLEGGQHPDVIRASDMIGKFIGSIHTKLSGPVSDKHGFATGYEVFKHGDKHSIRPNKDLPTHMQAAIANCDFISKMPRTIQQTKALTEATKRVQGSAYAFNKIEGPEANRVKDKLRSNQFEEILKTGEYVCKAVQVGPTRQLLVINKACLHLLRDECRLFPELPEVTDPKHLNNFSYDAVLYFGVPKKLMGEHHMSGYVLDESTGADGKKKNIPTAWVARSNTTDYVGFLKKTLLTLHNEKMIEKGAVPIHGGMYIFHFRNRPPMTIVGMGDSGVGKSELIAKLKEMLKRRGEDVKDLLDVEVLAGDMLSLHRGKDGKVYGFGTETGDYVRMDDLRGTLYEDANRDKIGQGSITNPYEQNERITIPDICDKRKVLSPHRIDGIFYFNNYEKPASGEYASITSVEDAFKNLAQGKRINKGTSGDLPDFDSSIAHSKKAHLLSRKEEFSFSKVLKWNEVETEKGEKVLHVGYRDGSGDPKAAMDRVKEMFLGEKAYFIKDKFNKSGKNWEWDSTVVKGIEHDPIKNIFILIGAKGQRIPLTIHTFSPVVDRKKIFEEYEKPGGGMEKRIVGEKTVPSDEWLEAALAQEGGDPMLLRIAGTYFSNVFGPTSNTKRMEENIRDLVETATTSGVLGGVIYTQLARAGLEHLGPELAVNDLLKKILDPRYLPAEYHDDRISVGSILTTKLAKSNVTGEPLQEVLSRNMYLHTSFNAKNVKLHTKGIETHYYKDSAKQRKRQKIDAKNYDVVPPLIRAELANMLLDEGVSLGEPNVAMPRTTREAPTGDKYQVLRADMYDKTELLYRILLDKQILFTSSSPAAVNDNISQIWTYAREVDQLEPDADWDKTKIAA